MTTNNDNEKIELTEAQRDPYRALPTDFQIGAPGESRPTPGHGQHGQSRKEELALLNKRNPGRNALTDDKLATAVDKAGPPHIVSR
jgi:hypothetical protein